MTKNNPIIQRQLKKTIDMLLSLFLDVKSQHELVIKILKKKDEKIINEIIENEKLINKKHMKLFQCIIYNLTVFNSYAEDIRKFLSSLFICNELERIADFAGNLAASMKVHDNKEFDVSFALIYWTKIMNSFEITEAILTEGTIKKYESNIKKINNIKPLKFFQIEMKKKEKEGNSVKNEVLFFLIMKLIDRTNDHLENINEYLIFKDDFIYFKNFQQKN